MLLASLAAGARTRRFPAGAVVSDQDLILIED